MKFPLSWLKEYIDIELPAPQIAKILTMVGIEVDSLTSYGTGFEKVVIGKVLEVNAHPNAEKLVVASVTDGVEKYQVVCGASNCRTGMKTALALIGANITLPTGEALKIKKSKIRGVESFGMLCSGKELGISENDDGIIEFAEQMKTGADIAEVYADTIFEVSLTPNLNHAASLIGIARELSAVTGSPLKLPKVQVKEGTTDVGTLAKLKVEDTQGCPIFALRVAETIPQKETPEWMKKRLLACGIRPIHPAVDVTNYVLLEGGHPLHAFDLDKIPHGEIIIRKARSNEKITTLDGKERDLTDQMIVVGDSKKAISLPGVMGGENTEVTAETKRVLFEAAYFDPSTIRKTSKKLGISSDSSKRFERGADPNNVYHSLDRAAMLLQEITGATIANGVLSVQSKKFSPLRITCRLKRVNDILGTCLSLSEIEAMFQRLHFHTRAEHTDTLLVTVPTYRTDITLEIDLIEEIAKQVGYDNIPKRPSVHHTSTLGNTPLFEFERTVRERLIAEGLQEFLTCDLIGPTILQKVPDPSTPQNSVVKVLNPTSVEQSILRTSLLQGLMEVIKYNFDHENRNVGGFEVGKVHFKTDGQYQEPTVAAIVLTGESRPYHYSPKPHPYDFYDLKGMIENLLDGINIRRYSFRTSHLDTFHSGRQALIQVDGIDVGSLGEIHPQIQRKLDVPQRIYFAELNLTDLLRAKRGNLKMRPLALYPGSERDWTVTVKEHMPVHQLIGSIQHIPSPLLEEVSLVDIYQGEKVGAHLKNVTLHFVYRDKQKTISQEEVDKEHARIIAAAEHMLGTHTTTT